MKGFIELTISGTNRKATFNIANISFFERAADDLKSYVYFNSSTNDCGLDCIWVVEAYEEIKAKIKEAQA